MNFIYHYVNEGWLFMMVLYITASNAMPNFTLSPESALVFTAHVMANGSIAAICVCRLGRMHKKVLVRVKLQYILLLVASFANGFSTVLFRQYPSATGVAFSAAVLYVLWSDGYQWRGGLPDAASSDFVPMEGPHAH